MALFSSLPLTRKETSVVDAAMTIRINDSMLLGSTSSDLCAKSVNPKNKAMLRIKAIHITRIERILNSTFSFCVCIFVTNWIHLFTDSGRPDHTVSNVDKPELKNQPQMKASNADLNPCEFAFICGYTLCHN